MNKHQLQCLSKLRGITIRHPQFQNAYKQVSDCFELSSGVGYQQNLLCIGASGTGKSTLKHSFQNKYLPYQSKKGKVVPVLVVDIPSLPTVKNVSEAVLLELGDPLFNKGTAIEKTNRLLRFLNECGVKLIIFDEVQHFVDQGNKSTPGQAADWLKTIIDKSKASTILMGLSRSEHILHLNEQLRRRFSRRIDLEAFSLAQQKSYQDFVTVLRTMLKTVDMYEFTDLSNDLSRRIFYATNGIFGYMEILISEAFQIASNNNREFISLADFELAFTQSIWPKGTGVNNPFSKKFGFRKLIQPGMPFHHYSNDEV